MCDIHSETQRDTDQTRPDQTRPNQTRPAPWLRLADHGEDEPFLVALSNLSKAACHSTAKWLFGLAHSFSNGLRCAACHPVRLRRPCSGVASKGFVWSQWWRNQGCVAKVWCMCCLPAQYLECCALCSRTASCATHWFLRSCIHGANPRRAATSVLHRNVVQMVSRVPLLSSALRITVKMNHFFAAGKHYL